MGNKYSKWVSTWGTATSITDRREAVYAKDVTLRYPVRVNFDGSRIRLRFSNLTGTEGVELTKVFADEAAVTFCGKTSVEIAPGKEVESDEIDFECTAGQTVAVSIYLGKCTQMNAGTLVTGPLSGGTYAYGDFAQAKEFPVELNRPTNIYYFLNTLDVLTSEENSAICCYGDSITAQDWPDYLQLELLERGIRNVAVIRRAVCGTRILRQYDCIIYQAYGLKGETRFPIELNISGLKAVIIQHGINDIIHPVGREVNVFRPMSDMPTVEDMTRGVEKFYLDWCRGHGIPAVSATLLPIYGWRTYTEEKDKVRGEFNDWLRKCPDFMGCIDFDSVVRDEGDARRFADGFDSGDHLHPSKNAYKAMAKAAAEYIEGNELFNR